MKELAERIRAGDVRAVARACRLVDERAPGFDALAAALFPHTGRARVIGLTGAPGTGKSTLSDRLIEHLRARGERVGVVAIDPSSPFTGGALLGDRIRMQRHATDAEVFIRSLGTRGSHGGLSRSTFDMVQVLDAWGATTVLVETVGVGQAEVDVLGLADTVVVVVIPGMGDDVQANKAGILEIADVFALNKADRPGADAAARELEAALALGAPGGSFHAHHASPAHGGDQSSVAVVRTVATRGEGLDVLLTRLDAHARFLSETEQGRERRTARRRASIERYLGDAVSAALLARIGERMTALSAVVAERAMDPHTAVAELLAELDGRSRERT